MRWPSLVFLVLLVVGPALAQPDDARAKRAREALEQELAELTQVAPPRLEILYDPPAEFGFTLVEAEFTLDDVRLVTPAAEHLDGPGAKPVFAAKVAPGRHVLVTRLVFVRAASGFFSYLSGFRWKLETRATFDTSPGLEVRVRAQPAKVPGAKAEKDELTLRHELEGVVLAAPDAPPPVKDAGVAPPPPEPVRGTLLVSVTAGGRPVAALVRRADPAPAPETPEVGAAPTPATPEVGAAPSPAGRPAGGAASAPRAGADGAGRPPTPGRPLADAAPAAPRELELSAGAGPSPWRLLPGTHAVEVLAPGSLAQARVVTVEPNAEASLTFELQRAPAKPLVVRDGERFELKKPLSFDAKKGALAPATAPLVAELVDAVVRGGVAKLLVEVHTDNRGDAAALQARSEAHAAAIAEALRAAGLAAARVEAVGYGGSNPVASNLTAGGRKRNNRVVLREAKEK
jgi:outer membrane protein OmpA-like peptidoglycan-associated protein